MVAFTITLENLYKWFSTRLNSNRPAQLQRLAKFLKFWMKKLFKQQRSVFLDVQLTSPFIVCISPADIGVILVGPRFGVHTKCFDIFG